MRAAQTLKNINDNSHRAQGMAAATDEMVASIEEIGNRGTDATNQADAAFASAQQGRAAVDDLVSTMDQITSSVGVAADRVEELTEASARIGDIVSSIEDVASQTNLLALNATIEAARAGDAGKGFAVVASEVKNLSGQTAKLAEDIRARIEELRNEMETIGTSMATGRGAVENGQSAMRGVVTQMDDIMQGISSTTESIGEINGILGEQSQASNEIAQGVSAIATTAQANAKEIMKSQETMDGVGQLIGAQLGSLLNHNIPAKIVRVAKSDHVIWKKRLADMLTGKETLKADELSSHESCRLGKWYYGPDAALIKQDVDFIALEAPHREVHHHGKLSVKAYNNGEMDLALKELHNVDTASIEVLRILDLLQSKVTKMEEQNTSNPAF
jgi:methyl-accepting chemotaxis protein